MTLRGCFGGLTVRRGDELEVVGVGVDEAPDHVDLLEGGGDRVLVLGAAADVGGPELEIDSRESLSQGAPQKRVEIWYATS